MWYSSTFGPYGFLGFVAFYILLGLPIIVSYFFGGKQQSLLGFATFAVIACWVQLVFMQQDWIALGFWLIAWLAAGYSIFGNQRERDQS